MSTSAVVFNDAEVVRISALKGDELETRHADVNRRMRESLPRRCIDEFAKFTQGKVFAIVCGEAALSSLGRTSRSLIGERDKLDGAQASLSRRAEDCEQLARGADQKNSITRALGRGWHHQSSLCQLAAAMILAQWRGVASVLEVQISRESWEKGGLHVPEEWRLPMRPGDELPPELELVATDPTPPTAPAIATGSDHGASAKIDEPKVEEWRLPVRPGGDELPPELELVATDPTPPIAPAIATGSDHGASAKIDEPNVEDSDDADTDGLGFLDR